MDLDFTRHQLAFRDEARAWLADNIPTDPLPPMDTPEGFESHREWEGLLYEDRWSVVAWPESHGGRDVGLVEWLLFEEEYYRSGAPGRVNTNGISLLGPTLFTFGTEAQQDRFLPRMASGEEIWAQGWSEPDSGSDLASISTRGIREGEWFVLDGQKTWCSRGAWADWLFCIVRTDPESERHRGLSYLLVPADADGLERRPVERLDGEPAFADLFFDGCRVHESNLLGGEGEGWNVAMATTSSERGLNLRAPGRFLAAADRLADLYRELLEDGSADRDLLDEVVRSWTGAQAYRWQTYRTAAQLSGGTELGAASSMMKIFWSELDVELHATALRLLGGRGELMAAAPDAVDVGAWMSGYLFSLSGPIYAGTNEIQRNIVAERVLGLPRK
ncbi:MAG TPA: acyl-CoA dehydrogenase [Acidimicrobiaceae bacterium]|nr:acyl-CoA dehydrogenase [Acidimicrobiaceae bacterium]HAQ22852.1 acyl-CoA dehydrogenase [Acidimicrobiaceae bacterium]HCV33801.1 acyl-CoA dehydrogenase [Acidimicrobiaceae bacterium]